MLGVYFSGNGNTKFCVEEFVKAIEGKNRCISIEHKDVLKQIEKHETIVLGYPIYYSSIPKIMKDFLNKNVGLWKNKKFYIISTMGLFSGDGSGCAARILKKNSIEVLGSSQIKMPDAISDVKLLKKTFEEDLDIIKKAKLAIRKDAAEFKKGTPSNLGISFWDHLKGLFGQRLWFYRKTTSYTEKIKIDKERCIGCKKCTKICPMNNLYMNEGKSNSLSKCTMCYRCINLCPQQAITLIGKKVVHTQHKFSNFRDDV